MDGRCRKSHIMFAIRVVHFNTNITTTIIIIIIIIIEFVEHYVYAFDRFSAPVLTVLC